MSVVQSYSGQIYSVLCAIIWAFAVILFKKSGEIVHPIALNLFKNFVAIILFYLTIVILGQSLLQPVPIKVYLIFVVSGVLGLAIADTLFFMCLNNIGAGRFAIVACLHSPFIITLSVMFLKETMMVLQIIGVVFIVIAVLLTMRIKNSEHISRRKLLLGILWGVLSIAINAIGVVMIKPHLNHVPLLWAIEFRLLAGFVSLLIITVFLPIRSRIFSSIKNLRGLGYSLSGTFLGTYLSLLLWLAGMKYTQASIASALNQTSSVFVFIFAALILKEKISLLRVFAILLAITGIFLVFLG